MVHWMSVGTIVESSFGKDGFSSSSSFLCCASPSLGKVGGEIRRKKGDEVLYP